MGRQHALGQFVLQAVDIVSSDMKSSLNWCIKLSSKKFISQRNLKAETISVWNKSNFHINQ